MSETAIFSRDLWNFIDDESTHTNNISEAYNHKINNKVMSSNTNIYKILDIVHQEETLAKNSFERANLGMKKRNDNRQLLNNEKIKNL